tara:strand:+ start:233 stop:469 length:237 start_codon:yes stop_codon:yes gene_type:complete
MIIVNTLEDDKGYSFKTQEGEWIHISKEDAPNMGVAYDLLGEMKEPAAAPAPLKKEKKQKKAEPKKEEAKPVEEEKEE